VAAVSAANAKEAELKARVEATIIAVSLRIIKFLIGDSGNSPVLFRRKQVYAIQ